MPIKGLFKSLFSGISKMEVLAEIKQAVMGLLSRREYSRCEIERKYLSKFDANALSEVLDHCAEMGYQSDQRCAESLVRNKISQGYGLLKILQEGRRKGLAEVHINAALTEANPDWFAIATELYQRKFAKEPEQPDRKAYEKRMRYITSRGFSFDQAKAAHEYHLESIKNYPN